MDLLLLLTQFLAQETNPQSKFLLQLTDGQQVLALMQVLLKTLELKFQDQTEQFMMKEGLTHLQESCKVPLLKSKDQMVPSTMKEDSTHHQESCKVPLLKLQDQTVLFMMKEDLTQE